MQTMEQRMTRWEDQRTLKNLMGKYANCIILNREVDIFRDFWSARDDIALGFNDGWYLGRADVGGYYEACRTRNMMVAEMMKQSFPKLLADKSGDDLYGVGPFRVVPVAAPIIEIADDRETAKGLWASLGSYNDVETCGPLAHWAWAYFGVDFVFENGEWKIWHLQYLKDIDCVCGESWGKPAGEQKEYEIFAPLKDFSYPPFSKAVCNRELYSPMRRHTEAPRIPEPYATFAETFSYAEMGDDAV